MERRVDLPGAAHLVLADGVVPFDPPSAVFEAMLEGWARQQRVWFLKPETVKRRLELVRRLADFSNLYPWQTYDTKFSSGLTMKNSTGLERSA
ncbi:hypothetical protein [Saccharopolyspora sp. 5N708]|uniref:hypothetical protein n=1 Tax=Saccharopolyspora sp. 5N708 TaxID=3457424 RepID=UPI003FD13E2F